MFCSFIVFLSPRLSKQVQFTYHFPFPIHLNRWPYRTGRWPRGQQQHLRETGVNGRQKRILQEHGLYYKSFCLFLSFLYNKNKNLVLTSLRIPGSGFWFNVQLDHALLAKLKFLEERECAEKRNVVQSLIWAIPMCLPNNSPIRGKDIRLTKKKSGEPIFLIFILKLYRLLWTHKPPWGQEKSFAYPNLQSWTHFELQSLTEVNPILNHSKTKREILCENSHLLLDCQPYCRFFRHDTLGPDLWTAQWTGPIWLYPNSHTSQFRLYPVFKRSPQSLMILILSFWPFIFLQELWHSFLICEMNRIVTSLQGCCGSEWWWRR